MDKVESAKAPKRVCASKTGIIGSSVVVAVASSCTTDENDNSPRADLCASGGETPWKAAAEGRNSNSVVIELRIIILIVVERAESVKTTRVLCE